MDPNIAAIRSCKYLSLHSISEPDEGGLRLVIHEAKAGGPVDDATLAAEPLKEVQELLRGCSAITHGPGCRVFEVMWDSYIAYAVENESYARGEPADSVGQGRLFIEYTKSAYLDYVAKVSFASEAYPGPHKHWSVLCLDHIVNVVSTDAPVIHMRVA